MWVQVVHGIARPQKILSLKINERCGLQKRDFSEAFTKFVKTENQTYSWTNFPFAKAMFIFYSLQPIRCCALDPWITTPSDCIKKQSKWTTRFKKAGGCGGGVAWYKGWARRIVCTVELKKYIFYLEVSDASWYALFIVYGVEMPSSVSLNKILWTSTARKSQCKILVYLNSYFPSSFMKLNYFICESAYHVFNAIYMPPVDRIRSNRKIQFSWVHICRKIDFLVWAKRVKTIVCVFYFVLTWAMNSSLPKTM